MKYDYGNEAKDRPFDIAVFETNGYRTVKAVGVVLFPRTEHVETVVYDKTLENWN